MFYNCKEATKAEVKKEESQISFGERVLLSIHLIHCKWCRRFVRQSELLRKRIKMSGEKIENGEYLATYSADMADSLKRLIREAEGRS